MSLQHGLDALRVDFVGAAPPGRAALYDAKIKELQRTFAVEKSLKTGDFAPDFNLPNQSCRFISLARLLHSGPAVVTFYRGGWYPYCNPSASRLSASARRDHRIRRQARRDFATAP